MAMWQRHTEHQGTVGAGESTKGGERQNILPFNREPCPSRSCETRYRPEHTMCYVLKHVGDGPLPITLDVCVVGYASQECEVLQLPKRGLER